MGLDDDGLHTADPNDDGPITASGLRQYVLVPLSSKIDDLGDTLGSILEREDQQAQALASLAGELTSTPRAEIAPEPREYPWNFEVEVPAQTPEVDPLTVEFEPDYDAVITGIEIGYPDGIQQSVGVQLRTAGGEIWVPRGGTRKLAGDEPEDSNYVQQGLSIEPNIKVDADNPIVAQFVSTDPTENHLLEIDMTLRERVVGDA
jgi:hypothetical protein